MPEPTTEQVYIDSAKKLGYERGKAEGAFAVAEGLYGEPRPPLSGEYADDLTPAKLHERLGVPTGDEWDTLCDEVDDAFEESYYEGWESVDPQT